MLEPDFLKAISHPVRIRALVLFEEREASARELGEIVGLSGPAASHHVRVLLRAGLIKQVGTRPRRAFDEALWRTSGEGWRNLRRRLEQLEAAAERNGGPVRLSGAGPRRSSD